MAPEIFSWQKWFSGMIDITRIFKDLGTLIRMVFILIVAYLLLVGGVAIWKRWVPGKKPAKAIPTISSISCPDGKCEISSGDRQTKWGLITF